MEQDPVRKDEPFYANRIGHVSGSGVRFLPFKTCATHVSSSTSRASPLHDIVLIKWSSSLFILWSSKWFYSFDAHGHNPHVINMLFVQPHSKYLVKDELYYHI